MIESGVRLGLGKRMSECTGRNNRQNPNRIEDIVTTDERLLKLVSEKTTRTLKNAEMLANTLNFPTT